MDADVVDAVRRHLHQLVLVVLALALLVGCDTGRVTNAPPLPARVALSVAVQAEGATDVRIRLHYERAASRVDMLKREFDLTSPQITLGVELDACLGDTERVPAVENACSVSADVVLLRDGAVLDSTTIGPELVRPDAETSMGSATLYEVATVDITPDGGTFEADTTVNLTATPKDVNGRAIEGRTASWASSAPSVATVDATSGLLTAVAPGSEPVIITATVGGRSRTASFRISTATARRVAISGPDSSVFQGRAINLSAKAYNWRDAEMSGRTITWTTLDPSIALVSDAGVVTGIAPGRARVVAQVDAARDTASIVVTEVPVARVDVTLNSLSLSLGEKTQASATAKDDLGNPLSGRTVTKWASSDETIATVDGKGLVTAVGLGSATISATIEGIVGTSQPLSVTQVLAARVDVSLNPNPVVIGHTTQAQAAVFDASGNALTGRTVHWTSNNESIATVAQDGLVTTVGKGTVIISAQVDTATGSAQLIVTDVPVFLVRIDLANYTPRVGQQVQATATAFDANDNPLPGRVPSSWTSSDLSVATVDENGLVSVVGVGQASISATIETVVGSSRALSATLVPVVSVVITGLSPTLFVGQTAYATATPRDSASNPLSGRVITWSSSNPSAATVDQAGSVTGIAADTTTISATVDGVKGSVAVTVMNVVTPAGDVVVFSDIDVLADWAMQDANNQQMARNLLTYSNSGPRGSATEVWIDCGHGGAWTDSCGPYWSTFHTFAQSLGFVVKDTATVQGTLTFIPPSVKVIFLVAPCETYDVAEVNTFLTFVSEGGRLVFHSDYDVFAGGCFIPVQDQLMADLGSFLRYGGGWDNCSAVSPWLAQHQIMTGMTDVSMSCTASLTLGASELPLFFDPTNSRVIGAVAAVNGSVIGAHRPTGRALRPRGLARPGGRPSVRPDARPGR